MERISEVMKIKIELASWLEVTTADFYNKEAIYEA